MNNSVKLWDQRYHSFGHGGFTQKPDLWLMAHMSPARRSQCNRGRALDLGCGIGLDTQLLTQNGYHVTSVDVSAPGLKIARDRCPAASFLQLDFSTDLPFAPETFDLVVANLSLHYFTTQTTRRILQSIWTCLKPLGCMLARYNSVRDVNYGAGQGQKIEPGVYEIGGLIKRFSDGEDLKEFYAPPAWELEQLEENTTLCYGKPKVLWEVRARKNFEMGF